LLQSATPHLDCDIRFLRDGGCEHSLPRPRRPVQQDAAVGPGAQRAQQPRVPQRQQRRPPQRLLLRGEAAHCGEAPGLAADVTIQILRLISGGIELGCGRDLPITTSTCGSRGCLR